MSSATMREGFVSCRYNRELTAPRDAREETRKALCSWGLEDHFDVTQIIISELVTNAIRHGAGPVGICITYERGDLHIEVHDDGPGRPVRRQPTAKDESGRGLAVIDGLIDLYGGAGLVVVSDVAGDGKTVCVSIRLTGSQ
jgi:anti-sigma regulatory factor (Ser/Thr protein kinase)